MTVAEVPQRGASLVPGVHRVIRQLDAEEGPYAGALVTRGESVAVQIDCETLAGWAGWEHAGDEHVAGPVDIVRRHDGHDVLLPWCTERIGAFLGRRSVADVAFAAGELTTMVASLLRGLGELCRADGPAVTGDWWLTDDGRPMFVIGEGDDARSATRRLVERMQRDCGDRSLSRLLGEIRDGLQKSGERPGMPVRQLERWEAELFATAASRPLRRDVHASEQARDLDVARRVVPVPGTRREARGGGSDHATERGPRGAVDRAIEWARHRLEEGRTAFEERWSRRGIKTRRDRPPRHEKAHSDAVTGAVDPEPRRRGRRLVVACSAAAVVLCGGLLWPGGATGEPASGKVRPSPAASRSSAGSPTTTPTTPASPIPAAESTDESTGSEDPVVAARALLLAIRHCAETGDLACSDAVAAGSSGIVEALTGAASGEKVPELAAVDEYGDVAVIRVSSIAVIGEGPAPQQIEQMVVVVRVNEKWLVRDAYDVADQPG
ncbi:hypothetical protein [Microbacterium phyllosphaerae]|uniref:hypothetical protein n=1 Tax=Microbacterium phyllosphaerae TaxID=124798 RepID=UPI000EA1C404|nr:hypothetical protein [Microbacterium phyllosphaerae]